MSEILYFVKILPGFFQEAKAFPFSNAASVSAAYPTALSALVLAAIQREWVESYTTVKDRARRSEQNEEEDRGAAVSWSHPPLSRAGSRCHHQITLRSTLELCLHLARSFWPLESPNGLSRAQESGPREGSTVTLRGFKKDICFYSVLILGGLLGHFSKRNGCICISF